MNGIAAIVCAVLHLGWTLSPNGSEKCIRTTERSTEVLCRIRTLEGEGTSIASVTSDTSRLSIECNDLLLFESTLRAHYFSPLHSLTDLTINNCKLLGIPDNTFQGLRKLRRLKLRSKNYEWSPTKNLELSLNTFNGLSELQSLDMAQNNIKFIPSGVFCTLDNLSTLNLTHNRIKTVGQIGFGSACGSSLHSLDLSHNMIKSLPEDYSRDFKN